MTVDFSKVKEITIPEGKVAGIMDGEGRVIWQAGDKKGWQPLVYIDGAHLKGVAFGNGRYVAVGSIFEDTPSGTMERGIFVSSGNAKNWTETEKFGDDYTRAWWISFVQGKFFVCVSASGGGYYLMMSEDGVIWERETDPYGSAFSWISGITYKNGEYIITDASSGSTLFTFYRSEDGVVWSFKKNTFMPNNNYNNFFNKSDGYVLTGKDGVILLDDDFGFVVSRTLSGGDGRAIFANGLFVVPCANGKKLYSDDVRTWTETGGKIGERGCWVTYAEASGTWISGTGGIVALSADVKIEWSKDLVNWELYEIPESYQRYGYFADACYGDGKVVVVGENTYGYVGVIAVMND